jgi:hypothetical protein
MVKHIHANGSACGLTKRVDNSDAVGGNIIPMFKKNHPITRFEEERK